MRALKFFGFVLLFFVIVALLLPVFMKKEVATAKSITIQTSPKIVFRLVNDLKNWVYWSPFQLNDSGMQLFYSGPEIGEGAKLSWINNSGNTGGMTIIKSEPYSAIQSSLDFGNQGNATDEWQFEQTDEGVVVKWSLKLSELEYPFGRYFGFFLDGLFNPLQEQGLESLKHLAEKQNNEINIKSGDINPITVIGFQDTLLFDERYKFRAKNKSKLRLYLQALKYQMDEPDLLYLIQLNNETYLINYGFPVYSEIRESGKITLFDLPFGKSLQADTLWNEQNANAVHSEIRLYMQENKLDFAGVSEEFLKVENDSVIRISYFLLQ